VLFIGDDWAEAHHDVEIVDETGQRLAKRRLPEGVSGLAGLHELVADHLGEDAEPEQVVMISPAFRGPCNLVFLCRDLRISPLVEGLLWGPVLKT
jgi:hypothetical protein